MKAVLVAHCKHGNNVGFCAIEIDATALQEFLLEPSYINFTRHRTGDPDAACRFCAACAEDAGQAVQA